MHVVRYKRCLVMAGLMTNSSALLATAGILHLTEVRTVAQQQGTMPQGSLLQSSQHLSGWLAAAYMHVMQEVHPVCTACVMLHYSRSLECMYISAVSK